jgi:ectoine hydrolase
MDFEMSEYRRRIEKTRKAMAERDVELMIVVDPSNMAWLTGYDGWSFYVHQCVLLAGEGEPIWVGRGQDANGAKLTAFMGHDNIIGYPDNYVQSTERHPFDCVSKVITDKGWGARRIGVEMDNYYFSAAAYRALATHLPQATLIDANSLVNWQRAVKSEAEIAFMRRAARIVEAMQGRAMELIEPGMRMNALVAEITRTGILGADGYGGDYPAIVPLLPTGAGASAPHLTWSDQPFKSGEGTFIEIAGCYRRYHCPLSRTVFLGKPPQKFIDTEKAIVEGLGAALEAAKPGNTCEEVEAAWRKTVARYGLEKESRIGYSIGLSYPPDWGERTMSLRPADRSVLQPGMTFHMIPAIWKEDWGMEITEPFLVTERGAETFCHFPRRLFVKP